MPPERERDAPTLGRNQRAVAPVVSEELLRERFGINAVLLWALFAVIVVLVILLELGIARA